MKQLSEQEVRALRNQVYDQEATEGHWEYVKEIWMKPEQIAWLQQQVAAKPTT
jgi:hypothetical protein